MDSGPIPPAEATSCTSRISTFLHKCQRSLHIRSRERGPRTLERLLLLVVAHPDASLPEVVGEMIATLNAQVTILISEKVPAGVLIDGLQNHRFIHFG